MYYCYKSSSTTSPRCGFLRKKAKVAWIEYTYLIGFFLLVENKCEFDKKTTKDKPEHSLRNCVCVHSNLCMVKRTLRTFNLDAHRITKFAAWKFWGLCIYSPLEVVCKRLYLHIEIYVGILIGKYNCSRNRCAKIKFDLRFHISKQKTIFVLGLGLDFN